MLYHSEPIFFFQTIVFSVPWKKLYSDNFSPVVHPYQNKCSQTYHSLIFVNLILLAQLVRGHLAANVHHKFSDHEKLSQFGRSLTKYYYHFLVSRYFLLIISDHCYSFTLMTLQYFIVNSYVWNKHCQLICKV